MRPLVPLRSIWATNQTKGTEKLSAKVYGIVFAVTLALRAISPIRCECLSLKLQTDNFSVPFVSSCETGLTRSQPADLTTEIRRIQMSVSEPVTV